MSERMPTEFTLAADGTLFVSVAELSPGKTQGRARFLGWALAPSEVAELRSKPLASLSGVVLGCDGRIYGNTDHVVPAQRDRRQTFEGVALTKDERSAAVEELTRLAFNITTYMGMHNRPRSRSKKENP